MATKKPVTQKYVVLPGVVIAGDKERWTAGSLIELTDEAAAIHIAAGNVSPLDGTNPPAPVESVIIVHGVNEPEVREVK